MFRVFAFPSVGVSPRFVSRLSLYAPLSMLKRHLSWLRVLSLVGLVVLSGCGSEVTLFSSLKESSANEIVGVLLHANIEVQKEINKNIVSVKVPSGEVAKALDVLHQRGLPREQYEGMGQIFHKDGMISSPLEEQARYVYALSQELEKTLTKIDGVLIARVHVVLPLQDTGSAHQSPSSASVFIKYQNNYNLELLKPQIQSLVANAIPDLSENHVSIVLVAAHPLASLALSAASAFPTEASVNVGATTEVNGGGATQDVLSENHPPESHLMRWILLSGLMILLLGGWVYFMRWRKRVAAQEDAMQDTMQDTAEGLA